eukprot:TRINITY_DN3130_c0_g1_i1.p1 TRINITY_DN3130_c0_g1~~TRINITY_DN3130_c0_g1_i1.p1  ORF type:complete len:1056 (+),score=161.84 TRINITY_DN3130_c0_g1_i1:379-3168(+)
MLDRAHVRRWAESFHAKDSPEELQGEFPGSQNEARENSSSMSTRSEAMRRKCNAGNSTTDAFPVPHLAMIPKPPASRLADRLLVRSETGQPQSLEPAFPEASPLADPLTVLSEIGEPVKLRKSDGGLYATNGHSLEPAFPDRFADNRDDVPQSDSPDRSDADYRDGDQENRSDLDAEFENLMATRGELEIDASADAAKDGVAIKCEELEPGGLVDDSPDSRATSRVGSAGGRRDVGLFCSLKRARSLGVDDLDDLLGTSRNDGALVTSRSAKSETFEHMRLPGCMNGLDDGFEASPPKTRPISAPARKDNTEEEAFPEIMPSTSLPSLSQSVHKGKRLPAEFWCDIISKSWALHDPAEKLKSRTQLHSAGTRQYMLEELFDVTTERLSRVYKDMRKQSYTGKVDHAEALELGLRRCGLHGLAEADLKEVVNTMAVNPKRGISLREFEIIVARLKLAQLLTSKSETFERESTDPADATDADMCEDAMCLQVERIIQFQVIDYNSARIEEIQITEDDLVEFLFANRRANKPWGSQIVRWVHFDDLKLRALLGLTIKYSLHPSSVEDVINQNPAKMDRYGNNYFVAAQLLSLVSLGDGSEPIRVAGHHMAAFCCGPPAFDTIITVVQPDMNFSQDGRETEVTEMTPQEWTEKLKLRLRMPRSRLRERQSDFLFYNVLDLATSQMAAVTRAFSARLVQLDMTLHGYLQDMYTTTSSSLGHCDSSAELLNIKVQLLVLMRRLKGLHQILSDLMSHSDISSSVMNNFQALARRITDTTEDAVHLSDMCSHITKTNQSWLQSERDSRKDEQSSKLNRILFVLTTGTFVLAPIQLFAGIYGMNFVTKDGTPGIPELVYKDGYTIFWTLTLVYFALVALAFACYFWGRRTSLAGSFPCSCQSCKAMAAAFLCMCRGRKACCSRCSRPQVSCEGTKLFE